MIGVPDLAVASEALPALAEVDRLRLHNLLLQQQVCREQLNALTIQFLHTEQPKTLQARIDDLSGQLNALAGRLFAEAGLDASQYQLNVADGLFRRRSDEPSKG